MNGHDPDRISELPDEVLCHILSFLSTKFAARTVILSKRWNYLWASVPCLHFEGPICLDKRRSFINFVNNAVLLNNNSHIRKFQLKSYQYGAIEEAWIRGAIWRNVEELHLEFICDLQRTLPSMFFACNTLVCLELSAIYSIHPILPNKVFLPRLKILHVSSNLECNMSEFLSGCPSLKEMKIQVVADIDISSPSLTSLELDFFMLSSCKHTSSLNAPNLQLLHLNNMLMLRMEFMYINVPSLLKLYIGGDFPTLRYPDSGDQVIKLFRQVLHIRFLSLSQEIVSSINDMGGCNLPTFHNLSRLELSQVGLELVLDFLRSCPNLEVLVLLEGIWNHKEEDYFSWRPSPDWIPLCFLSLKTVKILTFRGLIEEMKLVEYVLKNTNGLQIINIGFPTNDRMRFDVMREILTFPRLSTISQVVLL